MFVWQKGAFKTCQYRTNTFPKWQIANTSITHWIVYDAQIFAMNVCVYVQNENKQSKRVVFHLIRSLFSRHFYANNSVDYIYSCQFCTHTHMEQIKIKIGNVNICVKSVDRNEYNVWIISYQHFLKLEQKVDCNKQKKNKRKWMMGNNPEGMRLFKDRRRYMIRARKSCSSLFFIPVNILWILKL